MLIVTGLCSALTYAKKHGFSVWEIREKGSGGLSYYAGEELTKKVKLYVSIGRMITKELLV